MTLTFLTHNRGDLAREARSQYRGRSLIGPLAIEVSFFWPDRRKHNWESNTALFRALNGILWHDAAQITNAHIMVECDEESPRIEMRLWEATLAG